MEINERVLSSILEKFIDEMENCSQCPFDEQCNGFSYTEECVDFFIEQMQKKD